MAPSLLPRTRQHGQHLARQNGVPLFELHERAQHGEPTLRARAAHAIGRRHLRGILLELKQLFRRLDGVVVAAFEGVRGRQVVDVVPVMAVAVELILRHPLALVPRGVGKGLLGVAPAAGLRVDVPRHVERVRDVGHQLRVFLAARPRVLGEGGALETVDDVVVHARDARAPSTSRPRRMATASVLPGADGFFSGRVKPRMIIRARSSWASTSPGCAASKARMPLTKASSGSLASGSRRAATAAMYIFSRSVALPGTWLNSTAFFAAMRAREVAGATCLAEEGAERVDLESRPPIAGGDHGDAPLRHGRRRVERGGLQEAALRLARPERMHLRHALVEELLRLGVGCGDREMHGPHAGQDLGGQRGSERTRRRRAIVAALRRLGHGGESEVKKQGELHGWFSSWRAIRCAS